MREDPSVSGYIWTMTWLSFVILGVAAVAIAAILAGSRWRYRIARLGSGRGPWRSRFRRRAMR